MSRESTIEAYVLKRQDYGETDQIATLFSGPLGKMRVLVKNAKSPASKLQPALQPTFLVQVALVGNSSLKKVIRAQALKTHQGIFTEPEKLSAWFVVAEMLLKSLADEQPNEELFALLGNYLTYLDSAQLETNTLKISVLQFQLKALEAIGLGVKSLSQPPTQDVWFDLAAGGFVSSGTGVDAYRFTPAQHNELMSLSQNGFGLVAVAQDDLKLLERAITAFVSYQIERELKSARHLMGPA